MPRPRNDSEILPARIRLENAFWELLSERDWRKITVTDVVREAGVNRNSFYYHYSGMPELADSAILHEVESIPFASSKPNTYAEPNRVWHKRVTAVLQDPEQRQRLNRLSLLAGSHSSPELVESLRDFERLQIISMLDLDADNLDLKTDLIIEFTVGGMLAILRRWPELSGTLDISDLLNQDVAVLAMGIYLAISKEDMLTYWHRIFNEAPSSASTEAARARTAHAAQWHAPSPIA